LSAEFYHISLDLRSEVDEVALAKRLDLALDWIQYMPTCWIVRTTSDAGKWYSRLKPLLGKRGHLFICRLDISQRQGWLPKSVWEWIQQYDRADSRRSTPAAVLDASQVFPRTTHE